MRKNMFLAVAVLFVLVVLSACSGGGGGAAPSAAPPTTPTNPPPTVPANPWVPTTPTTPATTTVVTVPGVTTIGSITTGNTGNGFTVIGLDAIGNIVVTVLDPVGLPLPGWPVTIPTPVGFTTMPIQVVTDPLHVGAMYTRTNLAGLQSVWMLFFDTLGNRITAETNVGDNVDPGQLILDPNGDTIYVSRKLRVGSSVPARIFAASLTSGHPPISVDPTTNPMNMLLQPDGLCVVGNNKVGKYSKDLSMILWGLLAASPAPFILDGACTATTLYTVEVKNANLNFAAYDSMSGAGIFSTESVVPALTDKAFIKTDSLGNVYFTIRGKLGKVDNLTGAVLTTSPPTVPVGDWSIIGTKGYFSLGSTIQVYDLTTL